MTTPGTLHGLFRRQAWRAGLPAGPWRARAIRAGAGLDVLREAVARVERRFEAAQGRPSLGGLLAAE